ncbi:MAG: SRPBCC domain-containing protein [Deltaproteobacteria bacterium]|nr:SRPBCC domain-containing protein [Deltaproteobacteria bacterium]
MAAKKSESNEISITRIYDAPVHLVWDAWIDPKQVAQWWGPRGFTLTTYQKDVRPGGTWTYTMHGPDGTNYENKTVFYEVEKHALLVYDHGGNDDRPPLFRVKVQFKKLGQKTEMHMRMILATPEAARETRSFVKKAGGNATWDRLGEFLDEQLHGKKRFIINRTFDAPLETMFAMWTSPEHVAQWMPPTGFTMQFIEVDIKPGGEGFYRMDGAFTMYGKIRYVELVKPSRIVYTQQFSDKEGGVSRHPGAPTWPETMLTVVELIAESPDETRVTVTWEPHGNASAEEIAAFVKERGGMTQGWTGSFDKLETYLSAR